MALLVLVLRGDFKRMGYSSWLKQFDFNYNDYYDQYKLSDEWEIFKLQQKIYYHEQMANSFKKRIIDKYSHDPKVLIFPK